jgi:predicted phage gp36 major capsid-like protein
MKSPIELPPEAAKALEIIEESQSKSRAIAEELAKQQKFAAARISAQLQAASAFPPELQSRIDELARVFEQTQRQLSRAAESAREACGIADYRARYCLAV